MKNIHAALTASALLLFPSFGQAIEGGTQTYLLGIRDSLAGVVPPAGVYFNNDLVLYSGQVPQLVIGGVGVVDPDLSVALWRPNVTYVFDSALWGGTPAVNISLPIAHASMDAQGVVGQFTGSFTDEITGFGDLSITPIVGWHNGNLHTSASLTMYFPTGKYETASLDVAGRSASVLNLGKNRFAADPTISMTYLDPKNGLEFSGALGVTISAENSATRYQTAPEFHFEGAVLQHLPSGWAVGVTGYAFQQFSEDSGAGAESIKASLGLSSLRAQVYGLGPVVTYSTKIGDQPVNFKAKYIKEFDAERVFEVDKLWFTLGFVF
ncbi:SphA family protein [Parasedimentitalea denitrificans]|uniref:SphA family protein n=1 Tax=Parasedimentitalea denitrificans TaxID=2211118 RepID=UPI001431202D